MAGKGAQERQPVGLELKDGLAETQVIGGLASVSRHPHPATPPCLGISGASVVAEEA